MTEVVHCKKQPYDVYIGRPSKWGNPYTHLRPVDGEPPRDLAKFHVDTREDAIKMYKSYLEELLSSGEITKEDLLALDGKTLGCWCHPKPCHGDIIISKINELKMESL